MAPASTAAQQCRPRKEARVLPATLTCDGSPDFPGCLLPHLDGRLLAVPGRVGGADQVGCILQGALAEAAEGTKQLRVGWRVPGPAWNHTPAGVRPGDPSVVKPATDSHSSREESQLEGQAPARPAGEGVRPRSNRLPDNRADAPSGASYCPRRASRAWGLYRQATRGSGAPFTWVPPGTPHEAQVRAPPPPPTETWLGPGGRPAFSRTSGCTRSPRTEPGDCQWASAPAPCLTGVHAGHELGRGPSVRQLASRNHPGRCQEAPEGLGLVHVQGGAPNPPLLQSLGQGLLVHQAAPRRVHQEGALSHLGGHKNSAKSESTQGPLRLPPTPRGRAQQGRGADRGRQRDEGSGVCADPASP